MNFEPKRAIFWQVDLYMQKIEQIKFLSSSFFNDIKFSRIVRLPDEFFLQ